MDLAVLTLASSHPLPHDAEPPPRDTIACYRLSGSTPQVWSVQLNKILPDSSVGVDLLGNQLPRQDPHPRLHHITAVHWSPDGQCLAAALASKSPSLPPTLIILSVHTGQLLALPTMMTCEPSAVADGSILMADRADPSPQTSFVSWMSLDDGATSHSQPARHKSHDFNFTDSIGQSLCDKLPKNLKVAPMSNIETLRNHMGPVYAANQPDASNNLLDHYPLVRFPPLLILDRHDTQSRPRLCSLLVVASSSNKLHFFINGTVYGGTTTISPEVRLTSARLLPQRVPDPPNLPESHRGGVCLQLVWLDSNSTICYSLLDLGPSLLPTSTSYDLCCKSMLRSTPQLAVLGLRSKELNEQLQLSHSIQSLLKDCFFAYFSMVKEWHVARMCGRKWYENFDEISKAHKVVAPLGFQMLQLLFLGQAVEGLRDFLGTKNADRIFTKWESTTNSSLVRIRLALVELLMPGLERLYILVMELKTHAYSHFKPIKLIEESDFETLLLVAKLLRDLLASVHALDNAAVEEDEHFKHFCKWLRSEFDYVAALENSHNPTNRPAINYDIMAVSKFIKRGEVNPLDAIIFSQSPGIHQDLNSLSEEKIQLARSYFDKLYDVNGVQERQENQQKLMSIISHKVDEKTTLPPMEPAAGVTVCPNLVTPDTSHFQMNRNVEFKTPTLGEHLSRQNRAAVTPSNIPLSKLHPSATLSPGGPRLSGSLVGSVKTSGHDNATQGALGLYTNLVHISTFLSEIFVKMFRRIGDSQSFKERYCARAHYSPQVPGGAAFCARFVERHHFLAHLYPNHQVVIRRTTLELTNSSPKVEESHVTLAARVGPPWVEASGLPTKVIDMDFFDDCELALLIQIGLDIDARYALVTMKYTQLFGAGDGYSFDQLQIHRFHQLESEFGPEKISLNGAKGRRIGCILSGLGRMLHVLDMELGCGDESDATA